MKRDKLKLVPLECIKTLRDEELKMIHGGIGDRPSRKFDSQSNDSKKKDTWNPPPSQNG